MPSISRASSSRAEHLPLSPDAQPRARRRRLPLLGLTIGTILTALLLLGTFRSSHVRWDHGHLPHDELHRVGIQDPLGSTVDGAAQDKGQTANPALTQLRPKRVAIVGAGASGSSAAFFLRRAARIMEERIGAREGAMLGEVVVVDKEGYVGGRSTTVYPHNNKSLIPVELGASIFVQANTHLVKAAKLFNLTSAEPDFGSAGVGIWNGTTFLYQTSTSSGYFSGWWDALSAVFRYGPLSPYRTNSAVSALLKKFALLYNPKFLSEAGAALGVSEMVERVGLGREMTSVLGDEWALRTVGVGERWMGEIMEGSTRTNYASDMDEIHALGAAVSMATSGAQSIKGGNWQIFDRMLKNASATVVLGTKVTDILPFTSEEGEQRFQLRTNTTLLHDDQPFDAIIFAAPWHLSPISKSMAHYFVQDIPPQKYTHLHVTLFTTSRPRPNPVFFGLAEDATVPSTILTSAYTSRASADGSTPSSGQPPPRFQSIAWHGETAPGSGEYTVKVFSKTYLNDEFLQEIAGDKPSWVLRKEWDSYPKLKPVRTYAPVEPFKGFHYLAALEPWVSTMETQTLSAREAVARIVQEWWGMGYGECRGGADAWDWTCATV